MEHLRQVCKGLQEGAAGVERELDELKLMHHKEYERHQKFQCMVRAIVSPAQWDAICNSLTV